MNQKTATDLIFTYLVLLHPSCLVSQSETLTHESALVTASRAMASRCSQLIRLDFL